MDPSSNRKTFGSEVSSQVTLRLLSTGKV